VEYGSSRFIGDDCVLDGLDDRVFVWFAGRSSNKQSGDASYCELERVNKGLLKEGCLIQIWYFAVHLQTSKPGGIDNFSSKSGSSKK